VFLGWLWLGALRMRAALCAWAAEGRFQILGFKKKNITGRGPYKWWTNGPSSRFFAFVCETGRAENGWSRFDAAVIFGGALLSNRAEINFLTAR
jgi:hypothetical protein